MNPIGSEKKHLSDEKENKIALSVQIWEKDPDVWEPNVDPGPSSIS